VYELSESINRPKQLEHVRTEDFEQADTAVFYAASDALWHVLREAMERTAETAEDRRKNENEKSSALSASSAVNPPQSTLTFRQLSNDTLIVDAVPHGCSDCPPEFRDVARVKGFAGINPQLQIMRPLGCDAVQRILDAVRSGAWQTDRGVALGAASERPSYSPRGQREPLLASPGRCL
jgi:hypothetical protein